MHRDSLLYADVLIRDSIALLLQSLQAPPTYFWRIKEGAIALPFMKSTYSVIEQRPRINLPPEILEQVYKYCTLGWLCVSELRRLYSAGVLHGLKGLTDRELSHHAVEIGLPVILDRSEDEDAVTHEKWDDGRKCLCVPRQPLWSLENPVVCFVSDDPS